MKKTTILIYKDITDPKRGLREATQEEWSAILQANKGLPMCQRRCFMEDSFDDCGVIDRMFIEVQYEEYLVWNRKQKESQRHTEGKSQFQHLSLDYYSEYGSIADTIADTFDFEAEFIEEENIRDYIVALSAWKPWGVEYLHLYLEYGRTFCTKIMVAKYGVTRRCIYKRKMEFENFTMNFFQNGVPIREKNVLL